MQELRSFFGKGLILVFELTQIALLRLFCVHRQGDSA